MALRDLFKKPAPRPGASPSGPHYSPKKEHAFQKTSGGGLSYSLIERHGCRELHLVAYPEQDGGLRSELSSMFDRVAKVLQKEQLTESVVSQTLFLRDIAKREAARYMVHEFFGRHLPATTYLPQRPAAGEHVLLELFATAGPEDELRLQRCNEHVVRVDQRGQRWIHIAQIVPELHPLGAYERTYSCFLMMRNYLAREGYSMEQILRTWLYQGDIVGPEGMTQRYKELNRARTDIFEGKRFLRDFLPSDFTGEVYPASTGIGADDVDVLMACLAMKTDRDDVVVKSLENPEQTSAFEYSSCYSPKSPKFARAMAHIADGVCKIFVSGTASITHSETRHVDDVAAQTHQTLDNIEALIAGSNLQNHDISGFDAALDDLALARVYVKRPEDLDSCRTICRQRLGATPVIYTIADVCRSDLLVEIEGIAIARRLFNARSQP